MQLRLFVKLASIVAVKHTLNVLQSFDIVRLDGISEDRLGEP